MATYYVDGLNGNDAHAGTSFATAFQTIAQAASVATSGDTVLICATTPYNQTATVTLTPPGTAGAAITFQGANASGVVDGTLPLITTATNSVSLFTITATTSGIGEIEFLNLKLTNTATTKAALIKGVTTSVNYIVMAGNLLDLGQTSGAAVHAVDFSGRGPTAGGIFIGNTIQNFMGWGIDLAGAGGGGGVHVYGNIFLGASGCSGGVAMVTNTTVFAEANSFDNCTVGIQVIDTSHTCHARYHRNSFHNCPTAIVFHSGAGATFVLMDNGFWGSTTGIDFQATGQSATQYLYCALIGNSFGNCTVNISDTNIPVYSPGPNISSDPWPNASSGDFRAASGSAIRGAAWPTSPAGYPSLTNGADVGAVQAVSAGGSSGPPPMIGSAMIRGVAA